MMADWSYIPGSRLFNEYPLNTYHTPPSPTLRCTNLSLLPEVQLVLAKSAMEKLPVGFHNEVEILEQTGRRAHALIRQKRCLVCSGVGHYAFQCSSKKTMDKNLKIAGLSCEWGAVKSSYLLKGYVERAKIYNALLKSTVAQELQRFYRPTNSVVPAILPKTA